MKSSFLVLLTQLVMPMLDKRSELVSHTINQSPPQSRQVNFLQGCVAYCTPPKQSPRDHTRRLLTVSSLGKEAM